MSKAVSDDPVRNGISRLDEMMSGAVRSILRSISYLLYCIRYRLSYYRLLVWLRGDLTRYWLACLRCFVFYSQLASRVVRTGSVQVVVYLVRHVVCSNTLCHYTFVIIKWHQYIIDWRISYPSTALILIKSVWNLSMWIRTPWFKTPTLVLVLWLVWRDIQIASLEVGDTISIQFICKNSDGSPLLAWKGTHAILTTSASAATQWVEIF